MPHQRNDSVPTLLESFPIPPSYIPSKPPTPLPNNPPPSRPPSVPLPPLPGPSRFSDNDLLILTSDARPLSVASSSSGGHLARSPSIASSSSRSMRSVAAPVRYPSISSAPRPSISFSISEEAAEFIEPYHQPPPSSNSEQLTRLAMSPMPFSDDDDDDDHLGTSTSPPIRLQSPLNLLRSRHNHHQDSISSIDMRDLPAADDDDDNNDHHQHHPTPFNAFRAISSPVHNPDDHEAVNHKLKLQPRKLSISVPSPSRDSLADPIDPDTITLHRRHPSEGGAAHQPTPSGLVTLSPPPGFAASPPLSASTSRSPSSPLPPQLPLSSSEDMSTVNPQQLHREMRIARSKSVNHKQALRTRSRSKSASRALEGGGCSTPELIIRPDMPPPPATAVQLTKKRELVLRSPSPDIDAIISSTPRFHKLCKQLSSSSDLDPLATRNSYASIGSRRSRKSSNVSATSSSRRFISDAEVGNGEDSLLDEHGDQAGEESDSSLDLHTPLPHLMVKHGLLSPHSKLLPNAEQRSPSTTPSHAAAAAADGGRPGSTLSMSSTVTKTGLKKDERDTPMRKERHRDGRLLRGGLGLTTGLGWSDSEDEDAPSPLTRRLSTLNLSRRSSASSMQSTSSYYTTRTTTSASAVSMKHPLSRSYSGGPFYHDLLEDNEGVDEWGQRRRPRTSSSVSKGAATVQSMPPPPPPTSWQGRASTKYSSGSGSSSSGRMRTNSAGSTGSFGAAATTGRVNKLSPPTTATTAATTIIVDNHNSDDTIHTPSTASSLSIPLPSTPQDELSSSQLPGAAKSGKGFNKDKTLPPLPLQPILKKQQSAQLTTTSLKIAFPRSRTPSTTTAAAAATTNPASSSSSTLPNTPGPVRPLQLPQRVASSISNNNNNSTSIGSGDRPAVPVPSIPSTPRYSTPSQSFQQQQHHYSHPTPPTPTQLRAITPSRSTSGLQLSTSASMPRLNGRASMPSSPTITSNNTATATSSGLARPKPRTGTGMAYKKSSYSSLSLNSGGPTATATARGGGRTSQIRAPMPLTTASLASVATAAAAVTTNHTSGVGGGGSSGLSFRTRSKTPVTAPTTPIGQAF